MRRIEIPNLRISDFHVGGDALLLVAGHLVTFQGNGLIIDAFAIGGQYFYGNDGCLFFREVGKLGTDADEFVIACGDVEGMTSKV